MEDVAEITDKSLISETLKKVFIQLDQDEQELIFLIFYQNKALLKSEFCSAFYLSD